MKIIKTSFLILAWMTGITMYAQTECVNGFAGIYPCDNIDLLSRVPISILANNMGNPEGSDIWGWTDPMDGKEYAIVATTNSTAFVDISDPLNPIFLGRLDTTTSTSFWRDVKVYNNHAFIVADNVGAHGMQIFDLKRLRNITNPPQSFSADAVYTGVNSCHNIVINEGESYAYLVGCNTFSGGVEIVDISNPLNPFNAGGYAADGYTHDAQVVTYSGPDTDHVGKEILIGSNETKVVILDISDKSNITKISEVFYPQTGYTHQGWFTDDQRFFLLGDETDEINFGINTRTVIFDFTDLDNPVQSSIYFGPSDAIDHNGYVVGNEFYLASYRAGLRLLDISNIQSPNNSMTEIGFFDTYTFNDATAFNGAWSVYPYFGSGNIIVSDIEGGLFVLRKNQVLSTQTNEAKKAVVNLYPNPASTQITISISESLPIKTLAIYNKIGQQIVHLKDINKDQLQIPIAHIGPGLYILEINDLITKKLIIN